MRIPSYKQIAKYIIAFGSVQGLNILIAMVRNMLVSRLLGPYGIGLISLYQSGLTLVQNSTNFGIAQSGVRTIGQAFDDSISNQDNQQLKATVKMIRSWSMIVAVLGFFVCIAASPLLSIISFRDADADEMGYSHYFDFIFLAPIVALMAFIGGELAVMKATRMLKEVATLSVATALLTLCTSIPIYYIWGIKGIIPSLLVAVFIQAIITIWYSYRAYPLQMSFSRSFLRGGKDMIHLGIAFIIAGILGSGAEFLIRAFINHEACEDAVGLYNAGYMMAFTYAGMIFAAFDNEYFPRLSTLCESNNKTEVRITILRQMKVSLMFVIPMVIILIPLLPYIIPLLFSSRFVDATPMAQVTLLAMIIRAIVLPLEYLPLAKGDSTSYLILESVYDILIVIGVCTGFHFFGLIGSGAAIVLASFASMIFDIIYIKIKY